MEELFLKGKTPSEYIAKVGCDLFTRASENAPLAFRGHGDEIITQLFERAE
jgi:hypothetical protein